MFGDGQSMLWLVPGTGGTKVTFDADFFNFSLFSWVNSTGLAGLQAGREYPVR